MNPESGGVLSSKETDSFLWLDQHSHPQPMVVPATTPPVDPVTLSNTWDSLPYDVRGKPDIAIQAILLNTDADEGTFAFYLYTSLDGVDWSMIDPGLFTVVVDSNFPISGEGSIFLSIFLKTNFLKVRFAAQYPGPYDPTWQLNALIVAGEV